MIKELSDVVNYEFKFTNLLSFSAIEQLRDSFFDEEYSLSSIKRYSVALSSEFSKLYNKNLNKFFVQRCSVCKKVYLFGKWDHYDLRDGIDVSIYHEYYTFTDGFCSPKCMSKGSKIPIKMAIEIFSSVE